VKRLAACGEPVEGTPSGVIALSSCWAAAAWVRCGAHDTDTERIVASLMQIAAATCNVGDAEEFSQSGMRPAVRRCLTEQSLEPNTLLTTACRGHHECSASTQPHSSSRIGAYP
jgi:hypothetical protein